MLSEDGIFRLSQRTANNNSQSSGSKKRVAENSNNQQPCTFEAAFGGVPVDPNIRNAQSRFEEHPESLGEEARRLRS
jgi:hypothetical protein